MNNKETLQSIAFEISDFLSEYVSVHNKILKKAGSFMSLFKYVNFQELYNDTKNILLKFNSKQREVVDLKTELHDSLTQAERHFLDCLIEYVDALIETVKVLHNKVDLLYRRSQNHINLSFKELQAVDKRYEGCISKYLKIGEHLNALYMKMEKDR